MGAPPGRRASMIPYWALFSTFAALALASGGRAGRYPAAAALMVAASIVAGMIGLRDQVGADWANYVSHYERVGYLSLRTVITQGDPGYYLVNWIANRAGLGLWAVNLFCGIVFSAGLFSFARTLPQPWLAIVVAVPYLVIVVAMGYSRQGVAIGFVLLGLAALNRGSFPTLIFWILVGTAFHKTALIMLPMVALANARSRVPTLFAVAALSIILYFLFVDSGLDSLMATYFNEAQDSEGAAVRVAMNAIPALLLLVNARRLDFSATTHRLWLIFALAALMLVPALFLLPSSTLVDRLALYLIPLQLFVYAFLPAAWGKPERPSRIVTLGIVAYSATVLFVWLNFASHSEQWVPYRFYPIEHAALAGATG